MRFITLSCSELVRLSTVDGSVLSVAAVFLPFRLPEEGAWRCYKLQTTNHNLLFVQTVS